jgi:hypothetical protein
MFYFAMWKRLFHADTLHFVPRTKNFATQKIIPHCEI